jgi:hypothetical protein
MLSRCQSRVSPLALTNCALLAWTFSDSVRGLTSKSIIDFAFGRSTPSAFSSLRPLGTPTRTFVSASPPTSNDHCSARSQAMTATVAQVPCLSDNYGYLLHDPVSGSTAAIDTPDAKALLSELNRRGWTLTHIWNTHQCVEKRKEDHIKAVSSLFPPILTQSLFPFVSAVTGTTQVAMQN